MPTYNCAEYITEAITSILNQTYKDFEFLIIDDGSTDNTEEILENINDLRIRYIKKKNTGLVDTLNYGLGLSTYDLILRMDSDDIAHPYLIEKQLSYLSKDPDIDLLSCWYAVFYKKRIEYVIKNPVEHEQIVKGLLLHSYIQHPSCLYNKNLINKYGNYSTDVIEDYGLWLRMMKDVKFKNIPEVLFYYRFRKDSVSRINIEERNILHYRTQQVYYNDLYYFFNIKDKIEEFKYRGWREFFYGDKNKARMYWLQDKRCFLRDYRIGLAFLLTKLPEKMLTWWKENRIRYRIKYWITMFTKENRIIRSDFSKLSQK
jgi:glycosyltransferase involved in cell wall biosynthesis